MKIKAQITASPDGFGISILTQKFGEEDSLAWTQAKRGKKPYLAKARKEAEEYAEAQGWEVIRG